MRGDEGARRQASGSQRAPGVEPEPSDPEQAGPDEAQYDAVRRHRLPGVAEALAEVERADERRNAGRDVHHGPPREIERREDPAERGVEQAPLSPHHVRHRNVDHERPQDHEQHHGGELHSLGKRAGDQSRSDDREHQLEGHEALLRDRRGVVGVRSRADAAQERIAETADEPVPRVKSEAVAHQAPHDRDDRHHREALHHRRQNVLLADQAAVEKGEAGACHQQDERRAHQHPGVVARAARFGHLRLELGDAGG